MDEAYLRIAFTVGILFGIKFGLKGLVFCLRKFRKFGM